MDYGSYGYGITTIGYRLVDRENFMVFIIRNDFLRNVCGCLGSMCCMYTSDFINIRGHLRPVSRLAINSNDYCNSTEFLYWLQDDKTG